VQQIHILNAISPYTIHSDVVLRDGVPLPEGYAPAWTFIIPVETVNSNTIVFEETSDEDYQQTDSVTKKGIAYYTSINAPYNPPRIDQATVQKYFSHMPPEFLDYLTIQEVFPWVKGSLFAADRRRFHSSDNFFANGLTYKRAIVAWTAMPI
jgi:hypothetical protein